MHFEHLKIFLAVAKHRSFTKAAQALYLSHSTTSRGVSALEAELGAALLIREGRSVRLTPAGELLQKEGAALLEKTETLESAVRNTGRGTQGQLSIASAPVYSHVLSGVYQDFCRKYSDIMPALYTCSAADVLLSVLQGTADLGLSFSYLLEAPEPALEMCSISPERFCVVVPVDHPLASRRAVHPEELQGERFIAASPGQPEGHFLGAAADVLQLVPTAESMFLQVRSGNGIALAPQPLAYEYGSGCALLDLLDVDTNFDMVLLWRRENANPTLKLFLDMLPETPPAGQQKGDMI